MRKILSFTIIILTLCSFACVEEQEDQFTPRELKPYDPVKAGAVIVESFDLTNVEGLSVYGNETWTAVYTSQGFTNLVTMVGIQKRSLDNPEEVLHFIDVEYLGTLTVPQSIIYDKPYIWMLAERDNQVQMLKLLPNG